ncbi:MAG: LptF/LptG family permease [Candidatus Aminicenantaceae bacterium]
MNAHKMFKFFDKYILKEFIRPFLLGLFIYTFVLLMKEILRLLEVLVTRGIAFKTAFELLVYLIPSILIFTIPMSILMGVLAGLSRLSADSEVMAFKTLGINQEKLLRPVMIFSFSGLFLTLFLTLYIAPHSNHKWVQSYSSVLGKMQFRVNPREFNDSIPNIVLFVQDIDAENNWKNVFVYFKNLPKESKLILAKKGRIDFYPKKKRAILELSDGDVYSYPLSNPEKCSVSSFTYSEEDIDVEHFFSSLMLSEKRVREKDIGELFKDVRTLRNEIGKIKQEAKDSGVKIGDEDKNRISKSFQNKKNQLILNKVEVNKKFAFPFACLIFGILALPLGISAHKGGKTGSFTISVAITLLYYILITAGEKLAVDGKISPFIGMWTANIIFALLGVYLFIKALKELPFITNIPRFFKFIKVGSSERKTKKTVKKTSRLFPRFPNILDRYIIRKYVMIFSLVFFSLVSISVIVYFFERIGNIYEHNKSIFMLFNYIRYQIPEFVYFILPVTALTATLLAFGLLSKFNEITAMKASGISVYRIILPLVLIAVGVSLLSFYIQEDILPYSNKKVEEIWNEINDFPGGSYSYLGRQWVLSHKTDRIYHYNYFDQDNSVFNQLSIYDIDFSEWTLFKRIYADKGYLKGTKLTLNDSWQRVFHNKRPVQFDKKEKVKLTGVERKSYFVRELKSPIQMKYGELKEYIEKIQEKGYETARYSVDLKYKITFPLASLVMTLLGIPFAFSMGKRGALVGIGLSLIIALVYWGAIGIFRSLGYIQYLTSFLAAWGPNLIFGLVGVYLIFRLRT